MCGVSAANAQDGPGGTFMRLGTVGETYATACTRVQSIL